MFYVGLFKGFNCGAFDFSELLTSRVLRSAASSFLPQFFYAGLLCYGIVYLFLVLLPFISAVATAQAITLAIKWLLKTWKWCA